MTKKTGVVNLYGGLDMTKVMFGENAKQAGGWVVLQNQGDEGIMFAGATRDPNFFYGTLTHTLVVGEILIRPKCAINSDDFRGFGIGGFWTGMPTPEEWIRNGKIIV